MLVTVGGRVKGYEEKHTQKKKKNETGHQKWKIALNLQLCLYF